jgi:hypothetical protein
MRMDEVENLGAGATDNGILDRSSVLVSTNRKKVNTAVWGETLNCALPAPLAIRSVWRF